MEMQLDEFAFTSVTVKVTELFPICTQVKFVWLALSENIPQISEDPLLI